MDEDNAVTAFDWRISLAETFATFSREIVEHAPQLVGAVILLFLGWFVGHVLSMGTGKLIEGFDSLFRRVGQPEGERQERIRRSYSVVIRKTVFWIVMIFFITAAANTLGWKMFSDWMNKVVLYLPNLVAGLLIILIGFLLSAGARAATLSTAESIGVQQSSLLAAIAQVVILFTALVIGVQQIGIDVGFLTTLMIVVIGVFLAGGVLAFSLGSATLVANIIGAQSIRKHCRIGEHMKIGNIEGTLAEVTQTAIILDTGQGRTVVPAKLFLEHSTALSSD